MSDMVAETTKRIDLHHFTMIIPVMMEDWTYDSLYSRTLKELRIVVKTSFYITKILLFMN